MNFNSQKPMSLCVKIAESEFDKICAQFFTNQITVITVSSAS